MPSLRDWRLGGARCLVFLQILWSHRQKRARAPAPHFLADARRTFRLASLLRLRSAAGNSSATITHAAAEVGGGWLLRSRPTRTIPFLVQDAPEFQWCLCRLRERAC